MSAAEDGSFLASAELDDFLEEALVVAVDALVMTEWLGVVVVVMIFFFCFCFFFFFFWSGWDGWAVPWGVAEGE
jgi:hypothetical protein